MDGGRSCCCFHMKYAHKICGLATLCFYFFPSYDRSIEGGPLCKLRSRLLVAAGGSLRFGCQHPAPRRIRSRGHSFRIAPPIIKYSFEVYMQKERDSKPSPDKKLNIEKWPGVGPIKKNLRLTQNRCFSLVGLH